MNVAQEYLENLQGLLLFMRLKRQTIVSLQDLKELDNLILEDLHSEVKKCKSELLAWHNSRTDKILTEMTEYAIQQIREQKEHYSSEIEIEKHIKETEDYFIKLRRISTPSIFQDKITYSIIKPKLHAIVEAAASLGVKKNPLVLLGTLYTDRVNAVAIRMRETGQYIIAFESQIFSFLNRFVKIIVQALPLRESDDPDKLSLSFLNEDVLQHTKRHPTIKILFADLVLSYVIKGNVTNAQNFSLDHGRNIHATYLLEALELFIMGHEYSHILKGHLQAKTASEISFANITADEILRNWEQEYEADALGLFFMIRALQAEGFQEDYFLIGADLFFIITEIIDKSHSIKKFGHENGCENSDSHPPAKLRRDNLRKAFRMSFDQKKMARAEHLPNALEEVLYHLWDETKVMLYEHYDINKGKNDGYE